MNKTFFITGTDTGVGKTVLTTILIKFLREQNVNVAALKPICSGGRGDAQKIFKTMGGALSLDQINPWHFRSAVAPLLAARRERQKVEFKEVIAHIRRMQKRFDILLVEGAGGLLSPLGERFDSRDLIRTLRAIPLIVAQNKIGVINHILLTLDALPKIVRRKSKVILISPSKADASTKTNAVLLAEMVEAKIFSMPYFHRISKDFKEAEAHRTLAALCAEII